jgi:hypothetical protein
VELLERPAARDMQLPEPLGIFRVDRCCPVHVLEREPAPQQLLGVPLVAPVGGARPGCAVVRDDACPEREELPVQRAVDQHRDSEASSGAAHPGELGGRGLWVVREHHALRRQHAVERRRVEGQRLRLAEHEGDLEPRFGRRGTRRRDHPRRDVEPGDAAATRRGAQRERAGAGRDVEDALRLGRSDGSCQGVVDCRRSRGQCPEGRRVPGRSDPVSGGRRDHPKRSPSSRLKPQTASHPKSAA